MKTPATILSAAVLFLSAAAFADNSYKDTSKSDMSKSDSSKDRDYKRSDAVSSEKKGLGMSAEIGGGTGGFLDRNAAAATTAQGNWTGRLIFGTRSHLGVEAAYIGGLQTLVGNNFSGATPRLLGNGVEGALRLNLLTGVLQPYATAGVGWTHYNIVGVNGGSLATSDINDRADVAQIPLGVGLAFKPGGFIVDTRLAFHPAFGGNIFGNSNMSTWDLGARLGFEF
jgi:hypothetical protein